MTLLDWCRLAEQGYFAGCPARQAIEAAQIGLMLHKHHTFSASEPLGVGSGASRGGVRDGETPRPAGGLSGHQPIADWSPPARPPEVGMRSRRENSRGKKRRRDRGAEDCHRPRDRDSGRVVDLDATEEGTGPVYRRPERFGGGRP